MQNKKKWTGLSEDDVIPLPLDNLIPQIIIDYDTMVLMRYTIFM